MNGRWRISTSHDVFDGDTGESYRVAARVLGPEQRELVDVVPVDDAAIERATTAAKEHSHAEVGWHPDTDTFAVYFIEGPGPEWKVFKIVEGYATVELASADVGRLRAVAILRAAGEVG